MVYLILFVVGIVSLTISLSYVFRRIDYISDSLERWDWYVSTREISIAGPAGVNFNLNIAKNDRLSAWKIYTQITTRVAAVDFDEENDSALKVHESLYGLFQLIREEIGNIPIERVAKDRADDNVKFYLAILNDGLRPHLSKWHVPLSKWVENEQKKHPEQSIVEIEKRFPQRKELLESFRAMNGRMKDYADKLLRIVKTR